MLLRHGSRCLCRSVVAPTAAAPIWRHATSWSRPPTAIHAAAVDGQQQQLEEEGLTAQPGDATSSSSSSANNSSSSFLEAGSSDSDVEEQVPEFPEMRLQLPPPTHSQVKLAEFVKSSVDVKDCPPPKLPEFAVIGRSNVGKSSLINLLTNRKSLAMVSKQPGKTRCINHFAINSSWYLVDLPGYGYARTGKEARKEFEQFTRRYFKQRSTLVMVLLLVDCSIPPQDVDLEYAAWLGQQGLPFSIVFTKADKRKKGQPKHSLNVAAFKQALLEQQGFQLVPPSVVTSASTGAGKQELLNFIASLRVLYEQQQQQKQKPKQKRQPTADEDAAD